jgi:signal transduction histidine kinase
LIEENQSVIGSGKLITDKGVILVHNDSELIGKFDQNDHDEIKNKLSERKIFDGFYSLNGRELYKVYAPIRMGHNNHHWFFVVEVPAEEIYAQARKTVGLLVVIFALVVLSVFFYIKTVEKNRELKKLHAVKDKLFSVIAHDLRSPVGALISILQLANKNMLDVETQTQLFRDITVRVGDTYGLLDNLLRWSKSQMQGIVPAFACFDIQKESHSVTDGLQAIANGKNIVLDNCIRQQQVFADHDMFTVVMRNLVMNAIKYSFEGGKITLASELKGDMLIISVKDAGTGMPQEVQDGLFKLSETKSKRGTRNESGTGLGLVLCADFVKVNGGNIWFTSRQGEGSTFYFSIPVKENQELKT